MDLKNLFKKQTPKLCLCDYKDIWNKFCFLDESGSLSDPKNPFFTVGFIKCSQPYYLQSKISYERDKRNFHDEMHFNKLSKNNIEFCKWALDTLFDTRSISFHSYSLDKQGEYFNKRFSNDPWLAYEEIAMEVLKPAISSNEIIIVIADYITAPKEVKFEVNVKRKINNFYKRLAVAGVCRFNSKSNDLLQVADLMIGAINYDLKLTTGIIRNGDKHKKRFLSYFKENLGIQEFASGFKNKSFHIFVDKDVKQRLPLNFSDTTGEIKEKRPSS